MGILNNSNIDNIHYHRFFLYFLRIRILTNVQRTWSNIDATIECLIADSQIWLYTLNLTLDIDLNNSDKKYDQGRIYESMRYNKSDWGQFSEPKDWRKAFELGII